MKTAISIPDALFESAEGLAAELQITRSELYQRALSAYVAGLHYERQRFIEQVNEVCERVDMTPDSGLYTAQLECLPQDDDW